ncbi:hypothetical protein ACVILH_006742 [Bradyrhizobium sp. USDA 4353]
MAPPDRERLYRFLTRGSGATAARVSLLLISQERLDRC